LNIFRTSSRSFDFLTILSLRSWLGLLPAVALASDFFGDFLTILSLNSSAIVALASFDSFGLSEFFLTILILIRAAVDDFKPNFSTSMSCRMNKLERLFLASIYGLYKHRSISRQHLNKALGLPRVPDANPIILDLTRLLQCSEKR